MAVAVAAAVAADLAVAVAVAAALAVVVVVAVKASPATLPQNLMLKAQPISVLLLEPLEPLPSLLRRHELLYLSSTAICFWRLFMGCHGFCIPV